ncbi:MAG: GNAT family N-acetyltransferase [Alphaproteobacteria bacterium]|nr:MAG: GNAT family N-acetyltransferase [Alphaproteobacteria bacterium]
MADERIAIRDAVEDDVSLLLRFIQDLASYEKRAHAVAANEASLLRHLFGPTPRAHAVIAEIHGRPAGFAVYFYTFSTFAGRPGLYLEDLFVLPDCRGRGAGKALLKHLARKAVDEGCGHMKWSVLHWNTSSIAFYEALGAHAIDDWTVYGLSGDALDKLAELSPL